MGEVSGCERRAGWSGGRGIGVDRGADEQHQHRGSAMPPAGVGHKRHGNAATAGYTAGTGRPRENLPRTEKVPRITIKYIGVSRRWRCDRSSYEYKNEELVSGIPDSLCVWRTNYLTHWA